MKKIILSISILCSSLLIFAQNEAFPNGGFENWTGSGDDMRPEKFYSNKQGNSTARLGPVTATKETSSPHSGNACVYIESKGYLGNTIIVNGNLTSGFINAPSTQKKYGYVGTQNYDNEDDVRRIAFTSRPDSLVGWFKYDPADDAEEKAKVNVVLHKGQFNDPEIPVYMDDKEKNNHPNLSANKIASALFISKHQKYGSWTRFAVPFKYVSNETPSYVMITFTSSNNQLTTKVGTKLWLDDLEFIYDGSVTDYIGVSETNKTEVSIYKNGTDINVNLSDINISNGMISLIDLSGKEILKHQLNANEINTIGLPLDFQSGVYIYRIIGDNFVNNGKINL